MNALNVGTKDTKTAAMTKVLDAREIRKNFPILARKVNGKPLVYLDNAATSQKPASVIKTLVGYYENYNGAVHRSIHTLGEEATQAYEAVREKIRSFIDANDSKEIIYTRNTTESINLVAHAWGQNNIHAGDEIVVSALEHHSNLIPWQMLAKRKSAKLVFAELTKDGLLDLNSMKQAITERTKLVAVTQTSNALGSIFPIKEISHLAHKLGAAVLVDGAQGVPHMPTSVKDMGCDFLAFSMHKMLGPTGVGILWGRAELLESMPPFLGGGSMISAVWRDHATWNEIPWRFEAGVPNIADVIASGAAIDYLNNIGMQNVRTHEIELVEYALKSLGEVSDIIVYGPQDPAKRAAVVSFNVGSIHPHDIGQILNEDGIAVRSGHHCCQPLMRDLNIWGTVRASFYIYNTKEEVDMLCESLKKADRIMGHEKSR
jgi:cysteine desulfurase / selenocysteine lyase